MRSLLAIVFLSLLLPEGINAQCIVGGKVTDKLSGEPLEGVYVIYGKGLGTLSGNDGSYSFKADSGKITIAFQLIGYEPSYLNLNLRPGKTETLNVQMEAGTRLLDQVVISADRTEQKMSELTVSVNVIKSEFLSRNHVTDAAELITKTSGIEVLDGQASIRGGSGYSYGVGSRVLALVDGLPLLSTDAGGIRWQYLPVENLSQVEIIKGASSVLYGSSALNGIISFRSAEASNVPVTRYFSETGFCLKPAREEWKWWDTPRVYSTASFSHLRKTGNTDLGFSLNLFTDNSYRKYNDEKLGKLNLRIKHNSKKITGLNYGVNISSGLTAKTDFILWQHADSALVQDTATVAYLHGRFLAVDPFISFGKPGAFRHDLRMRIQSSGSSYPVTVQNNAESFSLYTEYQLWYRLAEFAELTAGLSETWNKVRSNFFGDHDGINLAAFTQAEFRPVSRLKLVAGVRLEQNILDSERDRLVPVFRTGVNFQAAQYTFLRASFGQGYRFPSIAEKYASTSLGSVTIFPNSLVGAESGWSAETGIKQGIKLGKWTGQADLAFFFSRNKDLIEYVFALYPMGLGFQATNVEHSRIYGTEMEFLLSRSSGKFSATVTGGYTFIYPIEFNSYTNKNTDIYLKYRRKHSAKLTFSTTWKKLETDINLYARSKILNIDEVFTSPATREEILPGFYDYWLENNTGYFAMDAGIGYLIRPWLKVSLAVKNLTNTEYMGRPADIQPTRSINIRVGGRF